MKKLSLLCLCMILILGFIIPISAEEELILEIDTTIEEVSEEELEEVSEYSEDEVELMAIASGTCGTNLTWTLGDEGTLTISGTGNMGAGDFAHNGGPWRNYKSTIKRIIIEDGVTSIYQRAFYGCGSLSEIEIPDSVTTIECWAFYDCSVDTIEVPDSVTHIWDGAFFNCNIREMKVPFVGKSEDATDEFARFAYIFGGNEVYAYQDVPSSLEKVTITKQKEIPADAFGSCENIETIILSEETSIIGEEAFSRCSRLSRITIPRNVTNIGSSAFYACANVLICGKEGSYAQEYASKYVIPFDNGEKNIVSWGNDGGYLTYTLDDEGTLIVSGTKVMENWDSSSKAPWYSKYSSIKKAVINDGVTSIGAYAFYDCSSLTSVTIPSSVTSIGASAFRGCSSLTEITIPESVTSIGSYAFRDCESLEEITLPFVGVSENATGSYDDRFAYIFGGNSSYADDYVPSSLKKVTITKQRKIPASAFYRCSGLTEITLPEGVTTISDSAFYGCSSLTAITIPEGVTTISDSAFNGCSSLTAITIPEGVTTIGSDAFTSCSSLTAITIPNGVTTISDSAFRGCSGLTEITIPESVISIGKGAFRDCESLEEITLPFVGASENAIGSYDNRFAYIFGGNSSNADDYVPSSLKKVTITKQRKIPASAFYRCSSLTEIILPEGVTSIGNSAFRGCSSLTEITIPDSVTEIGTYALRYCTSLTSVTIPGSVTTIGESAFSGCNCLEAIKVDGNNKNYSDIDGVLTNKEKTKIIAYPEGKGQEYNIPNGVTSIGTYAFCFCADLTSVTIPESVTEIGAHAFEECGITSIIIPNSVTEIGEYAFAGCGITSIIIPDSVKTIRDGVFGGCGLASITIPEGVTTIGDSAFYGCSSLTAITIPESVTSVGSYAFEDCNNLMEVHIENLAGWCNIDFNDYASNPLTYGAKLYINDEVVTDMTIPEGVTEIGSHAFYGCNSLTTVTIPEGVTSIGASAFSDCSNLASITIPESVTSVGSYAFEDCRSLTEITIPDGVTTIGDNAFSGCSGLTEITLPFVGESEDETASYYNLFAYIFGGGYSEAYEDIPEGLKKVTVTKQRKIPASAFYRCSSLTEIILPESVTSIGNSAFEGCSSLKAITIPESVTSIGSYAFDDTGLESVWYYGDKASFENISVGSYNSDFKNAAVTYAGGSCGTDAKWKVTPDGELIISGSGAIDDFTANNLPWKDLIDDITKVTVEEGISAVGDMAFYNCAGVKEVSLPSTITNVGYDAFAGTAWINDLSIREDGMLYAGDVLVLVEGTLLTGEIKEGTRIIAERALFACGAIKEVTIPKSVERIGEYAFYSCRVLETVNFGCDKAVWDKVVIDTGNNPLLSAEIIFGKVEYSITVTGTTGGTVIRNDSPVTGTFAALQGETISLTAVPDENSEFKAWLDATSKKILSTEETYSFDAYAKRSVIALFADKSTDDVFISFVSRNNQYVYYSYIRSGRDTGLYAPSPEKMYATGYTFKGYSPELGMVTENTDYEGVYEKEADKYVITVVNGTDKKGCDSFTATYNQGCTVVPEDAPEGLVFAGWKLNGKTVSYETEYTFYAFGDITVEAVFAESMEDAPLITMLAELKSVSGETKIASFLSGSYVPEGYTYIESGTIYVKTEAGEDELILENEGQKIGEKEIKRSPVAGNNTMFRLSASYKESGISARGYLICLDENGTRMVIYTPVSYIADVETDEGGIKEDVDMNP